MNLQRLNVSHYDEILSLLNTVFGEKNGREMDFEKELPKMCVRDEEHTSRYFGVMEDGALAEACSMGESYFQKLFKEKFGVSPKKYMIQLKINHACDLLRLEHYSITQIAQLCHFSDVYYFSRQFKIYTGLSPTEYVRKYRSSK